MQPSRLPGLLSKIALAALVVTPAACSSSKGFDFARFDKSVCTAGVYQPVIGLKPAVAVDYLDLRTPGSDVSMGSQGTMCATATKVDACRAAVEAILAEKKSASFGSGGWKINRVDHQDVHYLLYTRGDEVKTIESIADLRTFLRPIDTPNEAALLVVEQGHRIDCGGSVAATSTGFEVLTKTGDSCGRDSHVDRNVVRVSADGAIAIIDTEVIQQGDPNCVVGRRPAGLVAHAPERAEDLGTFFAKMAHLEAAAVPAFERLATELRTHGAPRRLIAAAERSARDEIRHARMIGSLAKRHGGEEIPLEVKALPARALEEIAIENVTEGCVRETFGALVATYQANAARDPQIAEVMRVIARDETRHAVLSWEIAQWARQRLDTKARARLDEAMITALCELRRDVSTPVCEGAIALAGFPDRDRALALLDALAPELLAA